VCAGNLAASIPLGLNALHDFSQQPILVGVGRFLVKAAIKFLHLLPGHRGQSAAVFNDVPDDYISWPVESGILALSESFQLRPVWSASE
jgi:hypothetical protein